VFVRCNVGDARKRRRARGLRGGRHGRWTCSVFAAGPQGLRPFVFSMTCPTDRVVSSCPYRIDPVGTP
jgi:hypothetical protein